MSSAKKKTSNQQHDSSKIENQQPVGGELESEQIVSGDDDEVEFFVATGEEISRDQYPRLYDALTQEYDALTQELLSEGEFKLPDLENRIKTENQPDEGELIPARCMPSLHGQDSLERRVAAIEAILNSEDYDTSEAQLSLEELKIDQSGEYAIRVFEMFAPEVKMAFQKGLSVDDYIRYSVKIGRRFQKFMND